MAAAKNWRDLAVSRFFGRYCSERNGSVPLVSAATKPVGIVCKSHDAQHAGEDQYGKALPGTPVLRWAPSGASTAGSAGSLTLGSSSGRSSSCGPTKRQKWYTLFVKSSFKQSVYRVEMLAVVRALEECQPHEVVSDCNQGGPGSANRTQNSQGQKPGSGETSPQCLAPWGRGSGG
eukprot:1936965-Amphidinium_carterae.1